MPLFNAAPLGFLNVPLVRMEYAQANDAAEMEAKLNRLIRDADFEFIMDVRICGAGAGRNFMTEVVFTFLDEVSVQQPVIEVDEAEFRVFRDNTEQGLGAQVNRFLEELALLAPGGPTLGVIVTGGASDAQTYMAVILIETDEPSIVAPEIAARRAKARAAFADMPRRTESEPEPEPEPEPEAGGGAGADPA